ncbi:MAG: tRNA (adenosine(37)-N6)-threonylcarbamoyltransferase complex ATPase subunit type 1 TsaE [Chitinispirillales bacterium]|nr:tRNA (adenosine(37)-N6)-threonylcarbamoyltransferase complex ATPase subunit type 1 TsaE [Chitinispirillales bacterium]
MREQSTSTQETRALGARLAQIASAGDVYSLDGDLGSGKTEFVRGFVEALANGAEVRSPTFSIVNTYQTPKFPVYHFDFYRIENPNELASIGFDEYIYGDGVCLIEWGELFSNRLPNYTKCIRFTSADEDRRVIEAGFSF